jgi:hypothetical protein
MAMVDAKMAQKQRTHRILTCLLLAIMTIISISLSIRFSGLDGILYGAIFAIILAGNVLHIMRASQLKIVPIVLDKRAAEYLEEALRSDSSEIRFLAHRVSTQDYRIREEEARERNSIQPEEGSFIFLEIETKDANAGKDKIEVKGMNSGDYIIFRCKCQSAPVAIASILLHIGKETKKVPHVYMGWTDAHPLSYAWKFILFGEGETAPLTRELIRTGEPNDNMRPYIHVA